jgi:hypothetical protein
LFLITLSIILTQYFSSCKYKVNSILRIRKDWLREFIAETFGTFIFLSFSLASVAQHKFSDEQNIILNQNVSFGFGLTLSICVVGKVSGICLFY